LLKNERRIFMKCPFCNSEKIEVGVTVVDPFSGTPGGPKYRIKGRGRIRTATMYSDFCLDCGSILKTYIDVPQDAHWIHGKSELAKD
jgi:hypothetical protein